MAIRIWLNTLMLAQLYYFSKDMSLPALIYEINLLDSNTFTKDAESVYRQHRGCGVPFTSSKVCPVRKNSHCHATLFIPGSVHCPPPGVAVKQFPSSVMSESVHAWVVIHPSSIGKSRSLPVHRSQDTRSNERLAHQGTSQPGLYADASVRQASSNIGPLRRTGGTAYCHHRRRD